MSIIFTQVIEVKQKPPTASALKILIYSYRIFFLQVYLEHHVELHQISGSELFLFDVGILKDLIHQDYHDKGQ